MFVLCVYVCQVLGFLQLSDEFGCYVREVGRFTRVLYLRFWRDYSAFGTDLFRRLVGGHRRGVTQKLSLSWVLPYFFLILGVLSRGV